VFSVFSQNIERLDRLLKKLLQAAQKDPEARRKQSVIVSVNVTREFHEHGHANTNTT
jgi:hypothetical protein